MRLDQRPSQTCFKHVYNHVVWAWTVQVQLSCNRPATYKIEPKVKQLIKTWAGIVFGHFLLPDCPKWFFVVQKTCNLSIQKHDVPKDFCATGPIAKYSTLAVGMLTRECPWYFHDTTRNKNTNSVVNLLIILPSVESKSLTQERLTELLPVAATTSTVDSVPVIFRKARFTAIYGDLAGLHILQHSAYKKENPRFRAYHEVNEISNCLSVQLLFVGLSFDFAFSICWRCRLTTASELAISSPSIAFFQSSTL